MAVSAPVVGGGIGTVVLLLLVFLLGGDPSVVLDQTAPPPSPGGRSAPGTPRDDAGKEFVSVVLADTEDVWNKLFRERGKTYREPRLVLFDRTVQSACGFTGAATGPFYCPLDGSIYIDLSFYDQLKNRLGAPGDFAQAYVIAHEAGHHVQNLLGISEKVQSMQRRTGEAEANRLSVRLELNADFLAGVWAHHAQRMKQILDREDLEEAIRAAGAIGDDRMQMRSRGYVVPDSFTHGSSEQRVRWFLRGWESGDLARGDTFSTTSL